MHDHLKNVCLLTDFYQFTMAQAYFDQKRHLTDAVFHLFFRKNPFAGNWALAAGINDAIRFVRDLSFDQDSLAYLAMLRVNDRPIFSKDFLANLAQTKMTVDIIGCRDGDLVFPHEPILRVQGPLFLCQLLETPLLNMVNFQTLIATKSKRIVMAAKGKPIIDFGMRRAQGFDGAISATKAAYIGGIDATSNVWAAKHFGIKPSGTLAHSFIMSYDSQPRAFADFCQTFPHNPVLLVDTHDPIAGVNDAIDTFSALKSRGHTPFGIRIDSGDLIALSKMARNLLDKASLYDCKIIASGDLDEYTIERLENADAPIDIYGVGTRLVTAYDDPALGGVYKLSSIFDNGQYRDTHKTSAVPGKISWPGQLSLSRYYDENNMSFDLVHDVRCAKVLPLAYPKFTYERSLHQPLMCKGVAISDHSLEDARSFANNAIASLPSMWRGLKKAPQDFLVYFDDAIAHQKSGTLNHYEDNSESSLAH